MLRFRSSWLAALVGLIVWTDRAPAVTVFSYDPSEGQLPTEQGWLGFEIDNDGPLTEPSVPGTSADNANAVIENFDGMNVLHIRDTLTDGAFDLPNYYYPWAPAEQQMLINNGVKFTMVFQAVGTQANNGNVRFGFNGTEFEIQNDNIGADQTISISNFQNLAPVDGNFHTLEITGHKEGGDFNFSYAINGGAPAALDIVANPAPAPLENAVYFGGLSSGGTGTDLLVKSVVMETLDFVQPLVATITRTPSSSHGAITLTNNADPLAIAGYSVLSEGGALNPTNWTSVADHHDASGDESIDDNDEWIKLSTAASRHDLSEFEPDGDGGTLATGQSIALGNVWIQNLNEDIAVELLLEDGSVIPVTVLYQGGAAFEFGDLDFDGDFDLTDFTGEFVSGFGASTAGFSTAERYQAGDFNEDDVVDEFDFLLYNEAYLVANPGAAALSLSAVPEPSTLVLLWLAGVAAVFGCRRQIAASAWIVALVALGVFSTPAQAASPIAYWNFDEATGATTLNDVVGTNDSTSIGEAVPGATGQIGGAWTFNNSDNAITIDPSSGDLTGLEFNYSFSTWVKSTDNLGVILSISDNTEPSEEVAFRVSDNGAPDGRAGVLGRPTIDGPGNEALSTTFVNDDIWHHVTFASSDSGWNMYVDGVMENTGSSPISPAAFGANVVNIGRNEDSTMPTGFQWGFRGMLDDTVVWDGPLTGAEVADLYVKGLHGRGATEAFSDALSLEVNQTTGATTLKNAGGTEFEIDLYRVVSAGDSLQASNWNSLDNQGFDSSAWTELGNTDGKVSEGAFGESTTLTGGFSRGLGNLYDTSTGAEDLVLEYHLVGTPVELLVRGTVNYVTGGGDLLGDYNGSGVVDAADYTVWRDTFGQAGADLAADGNDNGSIDEGDYSVWKSNFGETSGAGSSAVAGSMNVPEPATMWLCACAAAICFRVRVVRAIRGAALLGLLLLSVSPASADVFNDREYRLGDDPAENGAINTTVGSSSGGATYDSAGTAGEGDLQDLAVHGNPLYVDASDRPGASGTNRGASFDGVDDALGTPISLNAPTQMWNNATFFPSTPFPNNYQSIFSHGIQLWAKPNSAKQGTRQDLIVDTPEHGIFISEANTWGLLFDKGSIDTGLAVDFDEWSHVMELSGFEDPVDGASALGGALYINGVAVAAQATFYDPSATSLSVGSSQDLASNFYHGVLDEVRLFLWGDNTGEDSGDGRLGQNWGALDLAVDNDWIAQELAELDVTDRADVNLDGMVSGDGSGSPATDDVAAFVANWRVQRLVNGVQVGDWLSRQNGDLNYDGIVDLRDAGILHNGLVAAGSASGLDYSLLGGGTVPEPTSAALRLMGVLALLAATRHRS